MIFLPPALAIRARNPFFFLPFTLVGILIFFFIAEILTYIVFVSTIKMLQRKFIAV